MHIMHMLHSNATLLRHSLAICTMLPVQRRHGVGRGVSKDYHRWRLPDLQTCKGCSKCCHQRSDTNCPTEGSCSCNRRLACSAVFDAGMIKYMLMSLLLHESNDNLFHSGDMEGAIQRRSARDKGSLFQLKTQSIIATCPRIPKTT